MPLFPPLIKPTYTLRLPLKKGFRVGFFGGSFNPVHQGHLDTAFTVLKKLKLDRILWVVSPQNPLKKEAPFYSYPQRMDMVQKKASYRRFLVTDFEEFFGIKYTIQSVRLLKKRYKYVTFYLITGADNAFTMDKWLNFKEILNHFSWVIVARPPYHFKISHTKGVRYPAKMQTLFLRQRLNTLSSSNIRRNMDYLFE